jgi:general secretion pathway protein K
MAGFMTVHGIALGEGTTFSWPGRININTADVPVIAALLGFENQELAQAVFDFRQEIAADKDSHDFSDPKWYKGIAGLGDVALDSNLVATSSDVFSIKSEASNNETKTSITTVVQRIQSPESQKWTCKILSWKTE